MSISGISTTSNASAASTLKPGAVDFKSLAQALQSGDLAGAQQAFASLQQDSPWVNRAVSGAAPANGGTADAASPLQALDKALQSGDLAGAQRAFAALQQARGGHHGHHHDASAAASAAAPATTAPADTASVGSVATSTGSNVDTVA